jgi:3alpha(or 20beta)-hydroxysteroid dehydrogenase
VLADVRSEAGRGTAAAIGGRAAYMELDVTDAGGWATVVSEIIARHGRLDVLVNNAGIWHTGGLLETSPEDYRRVVEINQTGVFLGMHAVAPVMCDQRSGSIVNISSAAGLHGDPSIHAYVASKWAVRGMTKAAALELAPYGVRVNSVHPGLIQTPMSATEFEPGKPDPGARIPMRRVGQPEEVAELVCFLASDASAYISGAEVAIDGAVTA